ncbi:hypothetical protein [Candidatus Epulonipiscium viviparus]|uniref:hypothetical protein n=1 Tax=Candidatus Epulonipiscium viviparus TaxID=420336 RepID=UPI0027380FE9|nr:hypothetical protein [Candidatus Epulopiscium viviparus]
MVNRLINSPNNLATVDYTPIFTEITNHLDQLKTDKIDKNIKLTHISNISEIVARKLGDKNVLRNLSIDDSLQPGYLTLNHKDYNAFATAVQKLYKQIEVPTTTQFTPLKALKDFSNQQFNFGLKYSFADRTLNKKVISFDQNSALSERLRVDSVEIQINIDEVEKHFKENLTTLLNREIDDADLLIDQINKVNQNKGGVSDIIEILNDKSLARINRTISFLYLDYLLLNYKGSKTDSKYIWTQAYMSRFKLLEEYLHNLSFETDDKKKVYINMQEYDLCDLLCQGNAFDSVPFIGKVEGILSEDRSKRRKVFKMALKMKMNGVVQTDGRGFSSLEYHLNIMKDNLQSGHVDKALKKLFLFSFLMVNLENPTYDPVQKWLILKQQLENGQINDMIDRLNSYFHDNTKGQKYIKAIEEILTNLLKYRAASLPLPHKVYHRNLILYKGILGDIEGTNFLRPVSFRTEYLQNVSILPPSDLNEATLLNMPLTIIIQSQSLYETDQEETTRLQYINENMNVLPIIFYPNFSDYSQRKDLSRLESSLQNIYNIKIPYTINSAFVKNRIYNITYITLVYLWLLKYLSIIKQPRNLYIPLMRIHYDKQDEESGKCIRNVVKVFEHMLNNKYRAMSQGFKYDVSKNNFMYNNAVSSMYVGLPKKFIMQGLPVLDKIAILIITSRKTDYSFKNDEDSKSTSFSLILGEVILFTKAADGTVTYDAFKTFEDYYREYDLFQKPDVLTDIITELYYMDYKDIIYVSRAPYTSTINITSKIENMFFMNESVIENIIGNKKDLTIYPMYFEQFMATDYYTNRTTEALYISDTQEIDKHLTNDNKGVAGILNLYSGKLVGNKSDKGTKRYRSVIIYSALCNMYSNKQLNAGIFEGLVKNNRLKQGIVQTLIMLHYARYESSAQNITIKINPYNRLIGDDGVGARSILEFTESPRFNALGYLTDIKKILKIR